MTTTLAFTWKLLSVVAVSVPAILLFLRDWRFKNDNTRSHRGLTCVSFLFLIVATLLAISDIWIDPLLQARVARERFLASRPHPNITLTERSASNIVVEVFSPTNNSKLIEELFFSFDVPGNNVECETVDARGVDTCKATRGFRMGAGGDTVSESVSVSCKGLWPSGFARIDVRFHRTAIRPIPGSVESGITNRLYLPVMDLRDYAPCFYSWLYNGEKEQERVTLSYTNLPCVIEDNENLRRTVRLETLRDVPPALRDHARQDWPESHFLEIEEQRKYW